MFVTLPYIGFAWYLLPFGLAFQLRAKEVAESPLHREAPLVHVPLYHLWVLKWLAITGAIVLIALTARINLDGVSEHMDGASK
jgi:hypothetical protein